MRNIIAAFMTAALLAMPVGQEEQACESIDEIVEVRLLEEGELIELSLRDYLVRVVLQEMPASFEAEALKAQAVAARTLTMQRIYGGSTHGNADLCGESSCCQCYMDEQEAIAAYGDGCAAATEKVRQAVEETDGQVMTFDGELIEAAYFSSTGGSTECAADVWGGEVSYLQAVSSPEAERCSEVTWSAEEFRAAFPELILEGEPMLWFGKMEYTEGGAVAYMEIDGETFSGTEVRRRLGLRSARFSASTDEMDITFTVVGSGHGVGMSQYGANTMAQRGSSYREILSHYYSGAVLQECY